MDAVVEVHDKKDLDKISQFYSDIDIIGINHRNLGDFKIDLKITEKLLPKLPKDKIIISESGIETAQHIKKFKDLGVNGVLIGESLMRQKDITVKLNELLRATK